MKLLGLAFAAWLLSAALCFAQTPPGQNLNVPNSSGGGGGGVAAGSAITGCPAQSSLFVTSTLTIGCVAAVAENDSGSVLTLTGALAVPAGSAATNSIQFAGTAGTGLFGAATSVIISLSGAAQLSLAPGTLTLASTAIGVVTGANINWAGDTFLTRSAANTLRIGATNATNTGSLNLTNLTAQGTLAATLGSAIGTNAVCNTPATASLLTVQVWATGCAASAHRFKEAISAIDRDKAFETIMGMQPVSFFYNKEYADDPDKHIGFVAEQVNDLASPVAGYSMTTTEKDSDLLHGVKYNEMPALFVAAFQKIVTRSEERFAQLKADNDNLRVEIGELKRRVR